MHTIWFILFFCLIIRTIFTIQSGSQSCAFSREFGFGSSYIFFIPSNFSFGPNVSVTWRFVSWMSILLNPLYVTFSSVKCHWNWSTEGKSCQYLFLCKLWLWLEKLMSRCQFSVLSLNMECLTIRKMQNKCPNLNAWQSLSKTVQLVSQVPLHYTDHFLLFFCWFILVCRVDKCNRKYQAKHGSHGSPDPTVFLHYSWGSDVFCYWSGVFLLTGKAVWDTVHLIFWLSLPFLCLFVCFISFLSFSFFPQGTK